MAIRRRGKGAEAARVRFQLEVLPGRPPLELSLRIGEAAEPGRGVPEGEPARSLEAVLELALAIVRGSVPP